MLRNKRYIINVDWKLAHERSCTVCQKHHVIRTWFISVVQSKKDVSHKHAGQLVRNFRCQRRCAQGPSRILLYQLTWDLNAANSKRSVSVTDKQRSPTVRACWCHALSALDRPKFAPELLVYLRHHIEQSVQLSGTCRVLRSMRYQEFTAIRNAVFDMDFDHNKASRIEFLYSKGQPHLLTLCVAITICQVHQWLDRNKPLNVDSGMLGFVHPWPL